jgi:hypothetical protein
MNLYAVDRAVGNESTKRTITTSLAAAEDVAEKAIGSYALSGINKSIYIAIHQAKIQNSIVQVYGPPIQAITIKIEFMMQQCFDPKTKQKKKSR